MRKKPIELWPVDCAAQGLFDSCSRLPISAEQMGAKQLRGISQHATSHSLHLII